MPLEPITQLYCKNSKSVRQHFDCVEYAAWAVKASTDDYALWIRQVEKSPKLHRPGIGDLVLYLSMIDGMTNHVGVYRGDGKVRSKIGIEGSVRTRRIFARNIVEAYGDRVEFRRF